MTLKETLDKCLVGRRITSTDHKILIFDDGTTLRIYESTSDCGSGTFGKWEILEPDLLEAAITNVEYEENDYDDGDTRTTKCRVTIFHNQHPIALGEGHATLLRRPSWQE